MVPTLTQLAYRPWRLRLLGAHLGVQSSSIKKAAGAVPTATAQAGISAMWATALQAGVALMETAQAGVSAQAGFSATGASAQTGAALMA